MMNLIESIAIGLVFGFFFYEWVGFSAGGFVVPGYIALYWDRPLMIGATLILSLCTYGLVSVLSRVTILYGRRRFILMMLTGFLFQWVFRLFVVKTNLLSSEIDTIGYIIPGLIANEMGRQRIVPTILSLVAVSILVRLALVGFGLLRPW
jgi:poly-gamma-glutamate biosynthesis protein PgsC/CapC